LKDFGAHKLPELLKPQLQSVWQLGALQPLADLIFNYPITKLPNCKILYFWPPFAMIAVGGVLFANTESDQLFTFVVVPPVFVKVLCFRFYE
jgi:hypothetical protein